MAITSFTPGFTIGTVSPHKIDWSKGLSLGASNNVSLSNPLGDLNTKPKTGLNLLGNINMGQLATMALPMVTGALKSAANKPLQNMTPEQRLLFEAIYGSGDSVLGDLFNMKQDVQNSINNINNNARTNTGALGSTLALLDSYNSTNFDAFKLNNDKMSFGQGLSRIADSAAKGFSTGMATGNPVIGGILAAASAIGSGARMAFANKNRNTINNAAELALNRTLDSLSLLAKNTQKQMNLMNLANANYAALGGLLDYNIDDKYLANDYMSKLNNRVYNPLFDSMNYFAMGGMPDFNEFNTGGTHELNPNGGIPQGMDKLGVMNTVELGETKTTTPDGDYIFSDRLKLSKEECKKLGIPKNSTYAEASKILRKEYDEMPNDDIAKRGWEQSRDMLILSLEMQKQEIALKEARKQGLNNPKMQSVNPQMMLGMQYSENPQEEALLQLGINPNIPLAFGGYNQYGPGGFLEKVQNLMRSPEMRHAMSNANMARLMRNYENNTKVLGITENKYLEENGVPINEINMNNLLTTPQGDSTWMYTNERINGNNSLFNNINVTNNPLTGNYTYETYNGDTGNHVFEEEVPRNELPQEVLNVMNYNYSGNKEYKKGGYVRKFAGGSFLNPDDPPSSKNTYKLNNNGYTYIYENVPDDIYSKMTSGNLETADINDIMNQANNPNREWDLYLNLSKSRLPEGYFGNVTIDPEFGMMAEPTYVIDTSLRNPSNRDFSGYIQESENSPSSRDSSPWFNTNQSPVVNNSDQSPASQPTTGLSPNNTVSMDQLIKDGIIVTDTSLYKPLTQRKASPIPVSTEITPKFRPNSVYTSEYNPDYVDGSELPDPEDNKHKNNKQFDLEKLRYAPAIGSGLSLLNNLFTREDNSLANNYRNLAKLVNTYIPNNNNYNYLTYNPTDINALLNRQAAQQAAYRNAMRNSSNPNVNSSLLAQAYNDAIANGDLVNRLNAANRDLYNSVITGNNSITQQRNADNLNIWNAVQNAEALKRNYLQLAAEAENAERAKRDTAISQSANNFVTNLANIGNQAAYDKQFNIWQAGQSIPTNLAMRIAAGLIKELEAYDELKKQNYSKELADLYMKLWFGPKFNPATVKWK